MRGRKKGKTDSNSERIPQPLKNDRIAYEIVLFAIHDWRSLVQRKAWKFATQASDCNFRELRAFFKSEWCVFLMQDMDVTPEAVLAVLEKELSEAKEKDKKKEGKK